MPKTARKFIIIPEFAPLYAMRTCFGPTHGPLKQPTPTPIDVIGMLLKQRGDEKLTIMEVVKLSNGDFSSPVLLTPLNYRLPYDEIIRMENESANTNTAVSETVDVVYENTAPDLESNVNDIDTSDTKVEEPIDTEMPEKVIEKSGDDTDKESEDSTVDSPTTINDEEMLNAVAEELSAKPQHPVQNKRSGKKNHNRK